MYQKTSQFAFKGGYNFEFYQGKPLGFSSLSKCINSSPTSYALHFRGPAPPALTGPKMLNLFPRGSKFTFRYQVNSAKIPVLHYILGKKTEASLSFILGFTRLVILKENNFNIPICAMDPIFAKNWKLNQYFSGIVSISWYLCISGRNSRQEFFLSRQSGQGCYVASCSIPYDGWLRGPGKCLQGAPETWKTLSKEDLMFVRGGPTRKKGPRKRISPSKIFKPRQHCSEEMGFQTNKCMKMFVIWSLMQD